MDLDNWRSTIRPSPPRVARTRPFPASPETRVWERARPATDRAARMEGPVEDSGAAMWRWMRDLEAGFGD